MKVLSLEVDIADIRTIFLENGEEKIGVDMTHLTIFPRGPLWDIVITDAMIKGNYYHIYEL